MQYLKSGITMCRDISYTTKNLFLIGGFLLLLNGAGFLIPLRNSKIYTETQTHFPNDITLSYIDSKKELIKKKEETDEQYVVRITDVISKCIMHYWGDKIDEYHLRIPIWENYILFFLSYVNPYDYLRYEFCNYEKALERGVGLCSQEAIIEVGILRHNGIKANIIGLGGHTVLRSKVDKEKSVWYIADPDYGVVIPFDIDKIEENPDVIKQYYKQKGYSSYIISILVEIYKKDKNYVKKSIEEYKIGNNLYKTEKRAYFLKWMIPFILMAPFLYSFFMKRLKVIKNVKV